MNTSEMARWHRELCWPTDQIALSGDLPSGDGAALRQIERWQQGGVTHVMDVRGEWDDEELVAELAPELGYTWLGTHDDGSAQADSWFKAGVAAARPVLGEPDARMLVHCHMGVNRGPSMGLRIMLDQGWDVVDAMDVIRSTRPIAAVAYASDALKHHHKTVGTKSRERGHDRKRLAEWRRRNPIDTVHIIRSINNG